MRLLQLDPNHDETTALDLHPLTSVVTGLTGGGRERLLNAVTALPAGGDPGSPGLIEAHGILLDLTAEMLRLLDLADDRPVIVTADDVAAAVPPAGEAGVDVDALLAAAPPGAHGELRALKVRHAQAVEALEILRGARDAARDALEDARVRRRRTELTVGDEEVTTAAQPDTADLTDRSALESRRSELQATIARIDRGIAELSTVDVRPVQVLLDAIQDPESTELRPSQHARQLADELVALQDREVDLEASLESRGFGYRSAMTRLDAARAELAEAEAAARPPELTDQDRGELEAAHDAVLDAESARGRSGRRRLEEAVEREREILDRMGFPTWSAYVMGSTLMGVDPTAERRAEAARSELEAAERHWSDVAAMIEADPVHRELLDRLVSLYHEAFELLGDEDDDTDVVGRLRALQVPAREVSSDELLDALAYQLELIGISLPEPTGARTAEDAERVLVAAVAFVSEASAVQERIQELGDERIELLSEFTEVEAALAHQDAAAEEHGTTGEPQRSVDDARARGPATPGTGAELDELRAQEQDLAELLDAREAMLDTAIQAESVANGRLRTAVELAVGEPAAGESPGLATLVGDYLRARAAALDGVSYAGSVPLLVDDALASLDGQTTRDVLDRIGPLTDTVQVLYLTADDANVVRWAEEAGFERAAAVRAPAGFT